MKRGTLLLISLALVMSGFIYYYEIKRGRPRDETADPTQPAFTFKREDLSTIAISRGGQRVTIEQRDGKWMIQEPIQTPADPAIVDAIVGDVTSARVNRRITATAEEFRSFGLQAPAVILEVKLKKGERHILRLGSKDFSGLSVYGQIDEARDVVLLGSGLLTSADKTLNDLRDRSILGISQHEFNRLDLQNEQGTFVLVKQGASWEILEPVKNTADENEISTLVSEIASGKASEIVCETVDDLSKYGLDRPSIRLRVGTQGGEARMLLLGAKAGDRYYAKNSLQPHVFTVESSVHDRLNQTTFNLRDKRIIKINTEELVLVRFKNANLTLLAEKDEGGKWIVREPADQKNKEVQSWKIFDPLENSKATEILDKPPLSVLAKFRHPLVEIQLTDKEGKATLLQVSPVDGEHVWIRVEGRPEVYQVNKPIADALGFKMSEATP